MGYRLHLPSKIAYHNAGKDNLLRGNILAWEQTLTDRLAGVPLEMEARVEPTSILYHTIWLFLGSVAAAFTVLALIIWWVVKKGKDTVAGTPPATRHPATTLDAQPLYFRQSYGPDGSMHQLAPREASTADA